ncbi:MAG: hypothetical protein JNL74_14260 [Fibrobacteres bacterium]|nr:hypothetical protein [Fibrobacterota bacterium]
MILKARITFFIGIIVTMINIIQFAIEPSAGRIIGIIVGLFVAIIGWKIGWTTHRRFTILIGHIAVTIGAFVTAYGIYQVPFISVQPTAIQVLDLPIFWGLFTIFGGICMISHGHCNCTIRMHNENCRSENCKGSESQN